MDIIVKLSVLPRISIHDKLYVNEENAMIEIDTSYTWVGTIGRTMMNMIYGKHNRNIILDFYEELVKNIKIRISDCKQYLERPFVIGNFKIFGILPPEYRIYIQSVKEVQRNGNRLFDHFEVLKHIYKTDDYIYTRLEDLNSKFQKYYKQNNQLYRNIQR